MPVVRRRTIVVVGAFTGAIVAAACAVAWSAHRATVAANAETKPMSLLVAERSSADLPSITDTAGLDRYLEKLKAEARANGRATALQVEPGLQAIAKLRPQLGDSVAFEKSHDFSQQLLSVTNPK